MHKLLKVLTFMGAILALTFCAVACKTGDDDEPETAYAKLAHSGIYTESGAYYINVDSQSAPSDGNGAW